MAENARLKHLLAESLLDQGALKDLLPRKWWRLPRGAKRSQFSCKRTR